MSSWIRGSFLPSVPIREILLKLCRREDLTRIEAREAFEHIMSGEATEAQIGGLLVGLAAKGTTVEELVGAATVMREKSVPVGLRRATASCSTPAAPAATCAGRSTSPPPPRSSSRRRA